MVGDGCPECEFDRRYSVVARCNAPPEVTLRRNAWGEYEACYACMKAMPR